MSQTAQIPAVSPAFIGNDPAQYSLEEEIEGATIIFLISFVREIGLWKIMDYRIPLLGPLS